jgi:hypothetical protein
MPLYNLMTVKLIISVSVNAVSKISMLKTFFRKIQKNIENQIKYIINILMNVST